MPSLRRGRVWLLRGLLALVLVVAGLPLLLTALYSVAPPPLTPLMVIRWVEGDGAQRQWRPLHEISPHLRQAVIAAEDNLFCVHGGFDWQALRGEIGALLGGDRSRGASTITMQTAKNLYLWPGRSFVRKGLEAAYTPYLELVLSKSRILELYLNIAEWGPGIFGAEAAARHHFGKSAGALTQREATLLAAVLPAPRSWSPSQPSRNVANRATTYQTRIRQLGPLLGCATR